MIILEDIKDAGNLGTIIRSATAFGANGIIIVGDAVDLYNPKVVRSAVGNLWKLPIIYTAKEEINKIKDQINSTQNCKFYATTVSLEQPKSVQNCDFAHPSVIIFGSEADGISKELLEIADEAITIPMKDSVESLNLSISAGVILYESFRQRLHD